MPEPREHTEHRGALETLLRHIPGFRGYLEKEYRRDSDALDATWLADRLEQTKRSLDTLSSLLANSGQLELLTQFDRLRARLDKVIAHIKGAWQGYSGVFDLVRVDEALLDRIYEHDVQTMNRVEEFATSLERLAGLPARGPIPTPPENAGGAASMPMSMAQEPSAAKQPASTAAPADPQTAIPQLTALLDAIEHDIDQRAEMLKGLA